ncbi:MAG: hypothetical protein ACLP8X_29185 [Streptosporangiaceae bacterium]
MSALAPAASAAWKFSVADARERQRWDDYQQAFSEMLSATSTGWAPWSVIPADRKWFAGYALQRCWYTC